VNALVLGAAACVWDDYARITQIYGPWDGPILCVNRTGCWWPYRMEHWVTQHPERLAAWQRIRVENGYSTRRGPARPGEPPAEYTVWSSEDRLALDWVDELIENWAMSSGGAAVTVARHRVSADRVVLCGVPMDNRKHFHTDNRWTGADGFVKKWEERAGQLRGFVRSLSGWTAELLGEPTLEWLRGE